MKLTLTVLKLSVVVAVAACVLGGMASAQSLPLEGTFTLPYEVHWGQAILPAGGYTIRIDSRHTPAFVRNSAGHGRAILLARSVDDATKGGPTALRIVRRENQRVVQSFNWREGDMAFAYEGLTNAEGESLAKFDESVMVPILLAQK